MQGQETYSYYGPLNALTYNVGYHNEHHDFPQIPHSKLYRLRQIAPEFYNTLAWHTSWCWIIWTFLTDPEVKHFAPLPTSSYLLWDTDDGSLHPPVCISILSLGKMLPDLLLLFSLSRLYFAQPKWLRVLFVNFANLWIQVWMRSPASKMGPLL